MINYNFCRSKNFINLQIYKIQIIIIYKIENLIDQILYFSVTLQPFDFDPAEKNKHKFMVQALVAQDNDDEENPDMVCNIMISEIF